MNFQLDWRGVFEWAIIAGLAIVLPLILLRVVRGRQRISNLSQTDLAIDVATLGDVGPPTDGPQLELYHVPMRLAAVVLAPTGRDAELPQQNELPQVLEALVPGLDRIHDRDQPRIISWPAQLSSQGFIRIFFANVKLPGNSGRGTPWCAAAGRFDFGEQKLLSGLILRAATTNSLGQVTVDRPSQWLDLLRVKT